MQNEYSLDELLIRYLSEQTSTEEDQFVIEWINEREENKVYFEQLQNAWVLLSAKEKMDRVDANKEWSAFRKELEDRSKIVHLDEYEVGASSNLSEPNNTRRRILLGAAVAASILTVFALSYLWQRGKSEGVQDLTQRNMEIKAPVASVLRHEKNTTGQTKEYLLQDGSVVWLFDNSELEFQEPFPDNSREITLSGKAQFKVAKNVSKPFTVYSSDLRTTAIGTQFLVSNLEASQSIVVQLQEGRVLIQSSKEAKKKLLQDYYLNPGEELIYQKDKGVAFVRSSTQKNRTPAAPSKARKNLPDENPSVPKNNQGSWYMFNNQALADVLKRLEEMYGVEIAFSNSDVSNLYFIGKFDKTDSLDKILKEIAEVNNLKVGKEQNKFVIRK